DVGQRLLAAADAVARLAVEDARGAGLQRHPEVAQLGLVPLELALERFVVARILRVVLVTGDGGGDLRRGQEATCGQQADDEVNEWLGAARGPARSSPSS